MFALSTLRSKPDHTLLCCFCFSTGENKRAHVEAKSNFSPSEKRVADSPAGAVSLQLPKILLQKFKDIQKQFPNKQNHILYIHIPFIVCEDKSGSIMALQIQQINGGCNANTSSLRKLECRQKWLFNNPFQSNQTPNAAHYI